MTKLTLRGLGARKLRAGLTALAVLLGVMMISGTYVFTDTINASFDKIFAQGNAGTDVTISAKSPVDSDEVEDQPFSERLVDRVRRVRGVKSAAGSVEDTATIFDRKGDPVNVGGAPALMFSATPEPFSPFTYDKGRPPRRGDEVAIGESTADKEDFKVGDTVRVAGSAPAKRYRISGLAKFGDVSSFGGASIAVLSLPEAQRVSEKQGKLDIIDADAADGVTPDQLAATLRRELPRTLEVKTGKQSAQDDAKDIQDGLGFLNTALLAFAGVALFVGGFIIFNTFSITVAQRTTEFGLLRTMGASRRQILRSVVLEALLIGIAASLAGLLAGILAAKGIRAMFKAFQVDLPSSGTVLETRTIVVSLLVGTIVTVVAGLAPARRATRVSPLAAMRPVSETSTRRARRRTAVAVFVTVLGLALISVGLFGGANGAGAVLGLMGLGAITLFVGISLLSSRLVPPIATAIGWPIERLRGLTGRLARENAARNPGRTAITAAALMIGLALVTFVTVLAAGLRNSIDDTLDRSFAGDLVLQNKDGFSPIPAGAAGAVQHIQGVQQVSSLRASAARVAGVSGTSSVTGIDPRSFTKVWDPDVKKGPEDVFSTLGPHDAVLVDSFAKDNEIGIGDRLTLTTPLDRKIKVTVRGTVDNRGGVFNDVVVPASTVARDFGQNDDAAALIKTDPARDLGAIQVRVDRVLKDRFPVVESQNKKQFKDSIASQVNQLLALIYALLSLSIIVSLFGIVNTLVLSIHERTREIGMMRAIGTSRRQIRRIIRYESVITAMLGAALGVAIGLLLGWMTTTALSDQGLTFEVPVANIAVFLVLAIVAGVLAAIPPARRASRLNVLESLAYE